MEVEQGVEVCVGQLDQGSVLNLSGNSKNIAHELSITFVVT